MRRDEIFKEMLCEDFKVTLDTSEMDLHFDSPIKEELVKMIDYLRKLQLEFDNTPFMEAPKNESGLDALSWMWINKHITTDLYLAIEPAVKQHWRPYNIVVSDAN